MSANSHMMPLGEAFYRRKVAQIQERVGAANLDGILLLDTYNVMYASGFVHIASERPIGFYIPANRAANGDAVLFVPLLEQENAAATWIGDIRVYFEYPGEVHPISWMLSEIADAAGIAKIGIDRIPQPHDLSVRLPSAVRPTALVDRMRWIKEPEEIALVEQASRYADTCLEVVRDHAADIVRGGGTERDILRDCLSATTAKMKAEVGETFQLYGGAVVGTVHSGPRAALPHGSPLERQPQKGETLIAGIGAMVSGYHAESGATFILGEPSADQMRCLNAAAACNDAGVDALRAGATCASVNEAALAVLHEFGLGDAIRHRIGHGMGLQSHEGPWLSPGDETVLVPDMVFSNEPGIYRPGIDGYRTINSMIVTEGAARVTSRFLAEHPPEKRVLQF